MLSDYEKQIKYFFIIFFTLVGLFAAYFFFKYLFWWLLPFILASVYAYSIEPIVDMLEKRVRMPRAVATAFTIILTLILFGLLISTIITHLINELKVLSVQIPAAISSAEIYIESMKLRWADMQTTLPIQVSDLVTNALSSVNANLSSYLKIATDSSISFVTNFAASFPKMLISTIAFLLSTFFISYDKIKISKFLFNQMPQKWHERIYQTKDFMVNTFLKFIRAQLILMSITFVEMCIAFFILRLNYAIIAALIISLLDAFPILGTGSVLIPWAVFSFLTGNVSLGISLLVIYVIAVVVRNLLEPRIISGQIGLYPLITIISMYVGLQAFGLVGMLAGPITCLLLINYQNTGTKKLWRD